MLGRRPEAGAEEGRGEVVLGGVAKARRRRPRHRRRHGRTRTTPWRCSGAMHWSPPSAPRTRPLLRLWARLGCSHWTRGARRARGKVGSRRGRRWMRVRRRHRRRRRRRYWRGQRWVSRRWIRCTRGFESLPPPPPPPPPPPRPLPPRLPLLLTITSGRRDIAHETPPGSSGPGAGAVRGVAGGACCRRRPGKRSLTTRCLCGCSSGKRRARRGVRLR